MMNLTNILAPTPLVPRHLWAVLLAGGDGIRLRDLTVRIVGDDRPKQFCPIFGTESLLRQTRARLDPLFSGDRQVFVVSRAHERYYEKELADATDSLVVAQPMNRGTAVGIIAALVRIMQADRDAVVGFFPCDHYYSDDESFRSMVRSAAAGAQQFPSHSSSSGPRPNTRRPSMAGSNPGRQYWKHGAGRCAESIDSGKSQLCLKREVYYEAVASGIPSSRWATHPLSWS